jgi:hypothetical protein
MKRPIGGILGIVLAGLLLGLSACAAIDAGHEGVLVEQPFFFGHGGVDPVPSKTGRVWIAPTTHVVDVDIRPVQYSEHFDIISAENAPVSFDAFLIANVVEGRSPELVSKQREGSLPHVRARRSAKVSTLPIDDGSDDPYQITGSDCQRSANQTDRETEYPRAAEPRGRRQHPAAEGRRRADDSNHRPGTT